MTVQEVYKELNENYGEVFYRIGNDKWIEKYLKKFANRDYLAEIKNSVLAENWEELFKAAHTLKGLALNLGFSRLSVESDRLCECVRNGAPTLDIKPMYDATEREYKLALESVLKLD